MMFSPNFVQPGIFFISVLVTDFHLLKSLLVVFGFGSQAFICGFSRQKICSVQGKGRRKKSDLATRLQTIQVDNQKTGLKNLNHKGITKRG